MRMAGEREGGRPERETLLRRLAELEEDLGLEAEVVDEQVGTALMRLTTQALRELRQHLERQQKDS
ncbi:MAG: hypothetical protein M0031_05805 [Thermaerobacter sp.]|jgi:hypothetical protein|nr:hypothetical protein [Thermaerobacter sp.]